MNLSEEYFELMTRLLEEGEKYGINVNPVEALILAACYGPEITQAEIDLIHSTTKKEMEDLKIPINEMKVELTSTLVKDGFTLEEAKVISGEEVEKIEKIEEIKDVEHTK